MILKNYSNLLTVCLVVVSAVIISCTAEFDNFTPFEKVEKITSLLDPQENSQSISFSNETGISFTTDYFSIITIPPDAFDISGVEGSGEVILKYLEIYSRGDKIKYNVPTISNGELLSSDGVFHFEVFAGEVSVKLKPGKKIKVELFNSNPNFKMELFYGSLNSQDRFNWEEADRDRNNTDGVQIIEQRDSTGELLIGYEFFTDSLRWINVDVFVDIPKDDKTEVCVELPSIYNNQNTTVYMVFRDYNSVLAMHAENESSKFCEPYGTSPIGANVTFVVISKQGENTYHFAIEEAAITPNFITGINPTETEMADIIAALDNI